MLGLLFFAGIFALYFVWGENTVFDVHDQLDETICSYVIPARHLFSNAKSYSEMMCELPAESMKASAPLFISLYRIFSVEWAFLIQFMIETLTAFLGLYFLIHKVTKSSLAALPVALLFAMLPFQPVYGLNVIGIPLLMLCFYTLYWWGSKSADLKQQKSKRVKSILSIIGVFAGIGYFTLSTHIALAGYVSCGFVLLAIIVTVITDKGFKKARLPFYLGGLWMVLLYGIWNFQLILDLLFGKDAFVSHREEFVASSTGGSLIGRFWNIFFYGEETYAVSLHRFFLPVLILLTVYAILRFKKLDAEQKKAAVTAFLLWGAVFIICIAYAVLGSERVAELKNQIGGFLKHTDLDRFYYFLPGCFWMLLGILGGIFIRDKKRIPEIACATLFFLSLIPTAFLMKYRINLYDNVNYQNHGSEYTGTIGMAEYYHEDVLAEIDAYIGKEKSEYRIAHLGYSPAPSLVYGFYTVDGYSNNYPMEYKKAFRKVIAAALSEDDVLKTYFDTWGSRAYLYLAENHISEDAYRNLPYDFDALSGLGCEYLFSDREILETDRVVFEKEFTSSKYGMTIYLYRIY